ncbi:MAG: hypothetical protein ACLR2F_08975 [Akkermansia muciniphila]
MMETDTLMAEAFFFIRIENSHQEKTATPFIEKRETGGAKLFPERNAKAVFPGNDGNRGRQYGRNTAENSNRQEYSGIMRKGAFLILLFSMNLLSIQPSLHNVFFFTAGKICPERQKEKNHHPYQAIFMISSAIFHHETDYTYADSHAPIADHVYSVSESA